MARLALVSLSQLWSMPAEAIGVWSMRTGSLLWTGVSDQTLARALARVQQETRKVVIVGFNKCFESFGITDETRKVFAAQTDRAEAAHSVQLRR